MSNLRPYADLRVKVREYEKDGKKKGVYRTIGTLLSSPHRNHEVIQIDLLPKDNWDGMVYVDKRGDFPDPKDTPMTQNQALEAAGEFTKKERKDTSVDLSEIPF